MEERHKDPRRVELKKFGLRPEKYDIKGDLEGWVNQFEEYAAIGQWSDDELASLLFLLLTGGAQMYFVRLQEHKHMTYHARVEAL